MSKEDREQKYIIDDSQFEITLKKAAFDEIKPCPPEDVARYIKLSDHYEVVEIEEDEVTVNYTRKLYMEPSSTFEASITVGIVYSINNVPIDKDDIINEIEERKEELFPPVVSFVSHLLGTLTILSKSHPIITPPFFVSEKKETKSIKDDN